MDERLKNWHPTEAEVEEIVRELRPLIHELARRENDAITACTVEHPSRAA